MIEKLGAGDLVVGKTKNINLFPKARVVGSHIRPNVEIIASLKPDLIIASSERFFSKEIAKKLKADFYLYDPRTLDQILREIKNLGRILGKEREARLLVKKLKNKLSMLKPLKRRPRVVYEVMENPYMLAGKNNIVADIIERAGGRYLIKANRKLIRASVELILLLKPDIYIYQIGPMNKNPTPPEKRAGLRHLKMKVIRVKELEFARANTKSFDNVLWLNKIFLEWASR